MANPVLAALAQARLRAAPVFARWCELNAASFCPAAPATVERFVKDCAALGMERLWPALQDISKLHSSLGLADPTLSGVVARTIGDLAGIPPPRSWPDDRKRRFKSLPYDLQLFIAAHEAQREKALRRAQNDAAAARKQLAASRQQPTATEETKVHEGDAHTDA